MVEDKAHPYNVSLYDSQVFKIKNFLRKSKKFKTEASLLQYIIDEFFKKEKTQLVKTIMVYLGYPVIIMSLMLYVATSTEEVNQYLMKEGFFYDALTYQANIFFLIGFSFLGLTIASFYLLYSKLREK